MPTEPAWLQDVQQTAFCQRHLGLEPQHLPTMLKAVDANSLDELVHSIIPKHLRRTAPLDLPQPISEHEALAELRRCMQQNRPGRCFIGQGFYGTHVPPVVLRNILENPCWYTQYTPYQAEISQGRLELLFGFQTLVSDLTGLPFSNASLLDEASAVGEAMSLAFAQTRRKRPLVVVDADLHQQNLQVLQTRATGLGVRVVVQDLANDPLPETPACAVIVQVPDTKGRLRDGLAALAEQVHSTGALLVAVVDPLAQCVIATPASWGADVAVGSLQRFGLPMGFGGPHAGFMAVTDKLKRRLPGRIVGLSKDRAGGPAYRLALQTREQHIRRETATSNICTAQVLPALLATAYAAWHGPQGLQAIAERVRRCACWLAAQLQAAGYPVQMPGFDTVHLPLDEQQQAAIRERAESANFELRYGTNGDAFVSVDETTTWPELVSLAEVLGLSVLTDDAPAPLPVAHQRQAPLLPHDLFGQYHSEHEMLRFLQRLQKRDLSLAHSMIPLGSCTMKLNAAAEMLPLSWPEVANLHPHTAPARAKGYAQICDDLSSWLSEITELPGCSLQPNAGSQGEYAGLLAIRAHHESRGEHERTVCLIPSSAHGTNPASAVLGGFETVTVACDSRGDIDLEDLRQKLEAHADRIGAIMITYPSTHGVFEAHVAEICDSVHAYGGQVYMDGANMNAQVGLTSPGSIGADVCHVNLHKTFCIPHGGGGPGMGPICVAEHLVPFLPTSPFVTAETPRAVSAAPFGSASILTISWMYIRMMGAAGLTQATELALLNANYMAWRLAPHFPILFVGPNSRVAHEFVLDLRYTLRDTLLTVEDVAKRLMDFGFHAPTVSWPVPSTLMLEPTESESRQEMDRYCEALIAISQEIEHVRKGLLPADNNPVNQAPHTEAALASQDWPHPYSRQQAAFPLPWVRERKFWPYVARIDNAWGDRNLVCACSS